MVVPSGHEFGLAPLDVGWVVWRDLEELPDDLIFHLFYLGGDMPVFQINFSRPAGQIAARYYNVLRLGRDGYRRAHMASYDTGRFLAEEIVKLGPFELICDSDPARESAGTSPRSCSVTSLTVDHFTHRRVSVPISSAEASGFSHL